MESRFPTDFSNFELEITDRCNLACPRCSRTELLEKFPNVKLNHDLDLITFSQFIDPVIDQINIFEFKGTMGEPIFHPKFLDWVNWAKAAGKKVFIHTNGQAGKTLWKRLAPLLDKDDRVIFGIDGMPEDFMKYRVNAKWANLEAAINALRGHAQIIWQFIVFSYNEHEIEAAKTLSQTMGMDEFLVVHSPKWREGSDWLKPIGDGNSQPRGTIADEVSPDCLTRPMHIVTADGYYMPCCYLVDHRWRYKTPWAKAFDIKSSSINDVIKSSIGREFFAKLNNESAPDYCRFQCGKCNG